MALYPFQLLTNKYKNRTTSPGEELWYALHEWLDSPAQDTTLETVKSLLAKADIKNRLAITTTRQVVTNMAFRIISFSGKALEAIASSIPTGVQFDPLSYDDKVTGQTRTYCFENFGMSFHDRTVHLFADLAFRCAVVSREEISGSSRASVAKEVMTKVGSLQCYSCGSALGSSPRGVAFDHLWPQSLGGVSSETNLLPICNTCNGMKMNRISWEVFGIVHDYAYAAHGPGHQLMLKMALHHRAAERLSQLRDIPLKEAFLILGPHLDLSLDEAEEPEIFFSLSAHNKSHLPGLW